VDAEPLAEPTLRPLARDERIAVAIPTRNRPGYLAVLLAALAQQTYPDWMLVINDSSTPPVTEHDTVHDVLTLLETRGHDPRIIRSATGYDRHERAMTAVPPSIEFIVRIDDDVLPTPSFLESLLRPFHLLGHLRLAATGGSYPGPWEQPLPLDRMLADPAWTPRLTDPAWLRNGWRLQGHVYRERQLLEVDSLQGSAICYRRSAVRSVGGWAVEGYSDQAHREESDLCARLVANGWRLVVTTEALAWHFSAPSGGARTVARSPRGVVLTSDARPFQADERLFLARLDRLVVAGRLLTTPLGRFRLDAAADGPDVTPVDETALRQRLIRAWARTRRILRPARRRWREWRKGP
jgi:GT2 family glycosyltransferase